MGRSGRMTIWLAMIVAVAGCGSDGSVRSASAPATTTSVPVPSTAAAPSVPPTDLTLRITDVRLVISEEADRGLRVLLPTGVTAASVTLTSLPSPNQVISVCQVQDLDGGASGAGCRTPTSGEAVTLALGATAKGIEIVHASVPATPTSNSFAVDEVTIRYAASSREVNVRLPQLAPGDAGGRPSFALMPASPDGSYRATLTWGVIAAFGGTSSNGHLEIVQGATVIDQTQGGPPVRLTGNVPTPAADVAIRVQNSGASLLVTPKLTAVLP